MAHPPFKRGGVLDSQLEDLIEASSWKQAVALCEKRIKKGSKSDESLVSHDSMLRNLLTLILVPLTTQSGGESSRTAPMS